MKEIYEEGALVPDEVVVRLIEKELENSKDVKGFIFKGFLENISTVIHS